MRDLEKILQQLTVIPTANRDLFQRIDFTLPVRNELVQNTYIGGGG